MLKNLQEKGRKVITSRLDIEPVRVVWTQGKTEGAENLLHQKARQISLNMQDALVLETDEQTTAAVLYDFGCEIHGGIRINAFFGTDREGSRIRIRFGESVTEAMAELGGETNATNDHARRDFITRVGMASMNALGESGFRFVRIDLLDPGKLVLKSVVAELVYKDVPYRGTFRCSNDRLNRIWETGAYTMHLNMQEYIWDGVKRDRLVWIADMHPETLTVRTVFGPDESVKNSLDFVREDTPLPNWMNRIASYTMWYVIIAYDWYFYTGDRKWLLAQEDYLTGVAKQLIGLIGPDGRYLLEDPEYFLDWPSVPDHDATDAGVKAIHMLALDRLLKIFSIYSEGKDAEGRKNLQELCNRVADEKQMIASCEKKFGQSKPAAALLALAGTEDMKEVCEKVLLQNGTKGLSTYMAYYILSVLSEGGYMKEAEAQAEQYFGGMLDLGATTFWEDFDLDWMKNAAPIDRLPEEGEIDVHGTYGGFCYKGFRHSLCHGWASGVTAWLTERVLGIRVAEPGCAAIRIAPDLGDLEWAEGVFPTPKGDVAVRVFKNASGETETAVEAPEGIRIIKD